MKIKKEKVILFYIHNNLFIKQDRQILSKDFSVSNYRFVSPVNFLSLFISLIKQFIFLLFKGNSFQAFYIWFADYHAFLPVLFSKLYRKHSFLILGGYDFARDRKFNYGVFTGKLRSKLAIYAMRNTGNLITVSDYMKRKASFVLKRNDIERIYNALSFKGEEKISEKKMCFLTVGHIYNFDRFYIKGINEFINLAKQLPEFEFLLIGGEYKKIEEWFGNKLPENVVVLQKQKHDKLENYYQGAMFYCQFSRAESFSLSTVEAMYFGCIPILSKKGALPEIGKEFALYSTGNIKETAEKVRQLAKVKDRGLSKHMRKYIIDNFYIENRTEKLLSFLKMRMG